MSLSPTPLKVDDPTTARDLREWRLRVLEWIMRGILVFSLLALFSGIENVMAAYRREEAVTDNALFLALTVVSVYLAVTILFIVVTFHRKLMYRWRASLFLFGLYVVGAIGLVLSSLSGDGRVLFFAFIVLTAILFDLRASLLAFGISLATFILVGWMQVSGLIVVPAERQVNSTDLTAWVSGGAIFIFISIAALISITYLLRAFHRSLVASRESLIREQRLTQTLRTFSNINQLIVREQNVTRLLQLTCDELIANHEYAFVWIGLLEADGVTLNLVASAGDVSDAKFSIRLDDAEHRIGCVATALDSGFPLEIPPSRQDDLCRACPSLAQHPERPAVALPLIRENRKLGVIVADHADSSDVFDAEEIRLLRELSDDISYALDKIRADQRLQINARHQTLLADITRISLEARNMTSMLNLIANHLRETFGADACYLTSWDADGTTPIPVAASGYLDEVFMTIQADEEDVQVANRLRQTGETIAAEDAAADPRVNSRIASLLSIRSLLAVSMKAEGVNLGGIFLVYRESRAFAPEEIVSAEQAASQVALAVAKARLDVETQARATELGRLYSAAQDMAASLLNPPALLEKLARHIAEALGVTSGYVFDIHSPDGFFTNLAEYWTEAAQPAERKSDLGRQFPMQDYPTIVHAIMAGQAMTLHREDAGLSATERQQFLDYDIQSMLFIPIMARGRLLGDLELWESRRRREFTPAEIQLAQAIAGHAAAIIESAQLFTQTSQREMELATMLNVASSVSSSLDIKDVLKDAATSMARTLRVDYCTLSEYDPLTNSIETVALYEPNGDVDESKDKGTHYPLDTYITMAGVIQSGEAIVIRADDPNAEQSEVAFLVADHQASCLMLPLKVGRQPLGLVELYTSDPAREFADTEINLARALADQIAVAIENANLYNKVEQREAYFRALFENSAEGVAILDEGGFFKYITATEEKILGYDPLEVLGQLAFDITHPADVVRARSAFQKSIQRSGELITVEYRARHRDGSWRQLEVTMKNLLGEPSVQGIVANFRDITERKQAVEALEQREAYFRALIENSAEGVVILDAQGDMLYIAPSERRLTGYDPDEALGRSAFAHIHPDDLPNVIAAVQEGVSNPGVFKAVQYRIQCQNGEWRHFEATGHSMINDPYVAGIVINYRDITERKQAEQSVQNYADELVLAYENTLAGWARALELRDELTEGHTRRVTELTMQLARAVGISEPDLVHLRRGAILHDIGKMGIPDSILLKKGPLVVEELAVMRLHPQHAYNMLSPISFLRPALDIPLCHHEHWDGTGYPRGLKGEEIPLAARIFSVVDVWDALTSDRPYRLAWPKETARLYIRENAGKYFDPQIVDIFLEMKEF